MSVFEDDEGAVQFAVIPITKSNSKHIDVGHHVFRELTGKRYIGHPRAVRFSTCGFVDLANIQVSFNFQSNYDMTVFVFVFQGGGLVGKAGTLTSICNRMDITAWETCFNPIQFH